MRKTNQAKAPETTTQTRTARLRRPRLLLGAVLLLALIATLHEIAITHTAYPTPAHSTCLQLIRNYDYTKSVQLQSATQEMQPVQFVDDLIGGQPAALVQVQETGGQHTLSVYVYGCHMQRQSPALTTLFEQQGLIEGTASVTADHTLDISQLDTSLDPNMAVLLLPLQQNIFREYRWQDGSFVQTRYPALYPVVSRSEAEALQDEANHGQSMSWSDPIATSQQLAQNLFQWADQTFQATLQTQAATTTQVLLVHRQPRIAVIVTLKRLIQPDAHGLWFVTGAQSSGISIDQQALQVPQSVPTSIQGHTTLLTGQASIHLFDHTLTPIQLMGNTASNAFSIRPDGSYTASITYTNTAPGQTGVLLIEEQPDKKSNALGQLLLTAMLLK